MKMMRRETVELKVSVDVFDYVTNRIIGPASSSARPYFKYAIPQTREIRTWVQSPVAEVTGRIASGVLEDLT